MKLCEALNIKPGLTAVIGSGGKSTLLEVLVEELAPDTVILCTTTHIFPPAGMSFLHTAEEGEVADALARDRTVCIGTPMEDGRLCAPQISMERLMALADYVLVEADGSKRLPLKAHAPHEPVIPEGTGQTVCVVGLSGLGRPVSEAVHRPKRFAALTGAEQNAVVTVELLAAALNAEGLADIYYLNQADGEREAAAAQRLAARLRRPAVYGSLYRRKFQCW